MNPRTLWACHPVASMIWASVAPFARWISPRTFSVLLPSRGPSELPDLVFWPALGALLAEAAVFFDFPLVGVPVGAFAPPLGFRSAFGCSGSPRRWMRAQIRWTPLLARLKLSAGVTPGRL